MEDTKKIKVNKCYNTIKIIKNTLQVKVMNCLTEQELDAVYNSLTELLYTINKEAQ